MAKGALDDPEAAAAGSSPPPAPGASPRLVDLIRSHGVALVRGVPTDEKGTEALALRVGGHLRSTLYGPGMWATSAEASAGEEGFRDSAYSNDGLALHTDCGYLADPPGIQVQQLGSPNKRRLPYIYDGWQREQSSCFTRIE